MKKATLLAVPHDWNVVGSTIMDLVGAQFARVVHDNTPTALAELKASNEDLVVLIGGGASNSVLQDVLTWRDASGAKRVKWVHSYWTGLDGFQITKLAEHFDGVPLTNARGVFAPMLAEHVLLSMLYFNRQVWRLQAQRREGVWDRFPSVVGSKQTVGIIGYGDIGRTVAERTIGALRPARVFGLRSRPVEAGAVDDLGVKLLSGAEGLDEILRSSDFVVNVMPLTDDTRRSISRRHFQRMQPHAVYINIGRGATNVEDDLVDAIQAKEIRGAALDVFEVEPLPRTSRLWELNDSQLLLSPHNADISTHSYQDAVKDFADKAIVYCHDGTLPEYKVNLERGY
jgi:phosphoglycerate dehydrogenase-like enzyme